MVGGLGELYPSAPPNGTKPTRLDVLAALKGGRQPGRMRKLCDLVRVFDDRGGREQHDAIDFLHAQAGERALVFLGRVGFNDLRLQAQPTNGALGYPKLYRHVRTVTIAHHAYPSDVRCKV